MKTVGQVKVLLFLRFEICNNHFSDIVFLVFLQLPFYFIPYAAFDYMYEGKTNVFR